MAPTRPLWTAGTSLVDRLKTYWLGKKIEEPPAITVRTAFLCAVLFTIFYVAPFYLSSTLRTSPLTSRDAPAVIRARVRAVGVSCVASTVVAVYILVHYGHASTTDVLRLLGIWPVRIFDILKAVGLVAVLFVGPLYEHIIIEAGWRDFTWSGFTGTFYDSWTGYRNNLISPITEELVFRSLVISLYLLAKVAPARIVFTTPLIFGLAHVHHLVEFVQSRLAMGRSSSVSRVVLLGVVRSLFQFAYTSLFGFFAAFVFLRTGNLFAAIAAHSFCNVMGFPRLWGRLGQNSDFTSATPDIALTKRDDNLEAQPRVGTAIMVEGDANEKKAARLMAAGTQNLGIQWTILYYVLLGVGAYGFHRLLWPLTESSNALATFWKYA